MRGSELNQLSITTLLAAVRVSTLARTIRSRSRTIPYTGSFTFYQGATEASGGSTQNVTVLRSSNCSDFVGAPVRDSGFTSQQRTGVISVSGRFFSNNPKRLHVFHEVPYLGNDGEMINRATIPAPNGWHLSTVAGTNPSRPVFTPPQMIQDLITLPRMLREVGSLIRKPQKIMSAKELANFHLATQFGWKPLIEDLQKLLDLQSHILKRNEELNKLYSAQGLRRRLKFGDETRSYKGMIAIPGQATSSVSFPVSITVSKKAWATIRWKPLTPPPFHPADPAWNDYTRDIVLGLTPEGMAKGLWDVIPWTWLLGWFTNVGKYTLAHSNTVPASHSNACFMSSVTETRTAGPPVFSNAIGGMTALGTATNSLKTRVTASSAIPAAGFNVPYLDTWRLSILGALAIQRFQR